MSHSNTDTPGAPPVIRDHPKFGSGDFALVTPDGFRFRVDERYLRAASEVFNDMIRQCQDGEREIILLDPEIEDSTVVNTWLDLVLNAKISWSGPNRPRILTNLVEFFDKWSCTVPRKAFLQFLQMSTNVSNCTRFVVGAALRDPNICAEALFLELKSNLDQDTGRRGLDFLGRLDFHDYQRIPQAYHWALAKTCLLKSHLTIGVGSIPIKFISFLKETEQPPSS